MAERNPPLRLAQMVGVYVEQDGKTLSQAAREIGIDKSMLCRFVKGRVSLNGASLAKVLAWLLSPQERA